MTVIERRRFEEGDPMCIIASMQHTFELSGMKGLSQVKGVIFDRTNGSFDCAWRNDSSKGALTTQIARGSLDKCLALYHHVNQRPQLLFFWRLARQ
jgi:hypothetical protein